MDVEKDTFNININFRGEFVLRDDFRITYTGPADFWEVYRDCTYEEFLSDLRHYGWPEWEMVYYKDYNPAGRLDELKPLVVSESVWSELVVSQPKGSAISIYLAKREFCGWIVHRIGGAPDSLYGVPTTEYIKAFDPQPRRNCCCKHGRVQPEGQAAPLVGPNAVVTTSVVGPNVQKEAEKFNKMVQTYQVGICCLVVAVFAAYFLGKWF